MSLISGLLGSCTVLGLNGGLWLPCSSPFNNSSSRSSNEQNSGTGFQWTGHIFNPVCISCSSWNTTNWFSRNYISQKPSPRTHRARLELGKEEVAWDLNGGHEAVVLTSRQVAPDSLRVIVAGFGESQLQRSWQILASLAFTLYLALNSVDQQPSISRCLGADPQKY